MWDIFIYISVPFQLEKQQKKLESKGIHVDLSQLRKDWEAARNGGRGGNNEPIEEHEIDVVGDDSDNEDQGNASDFLMQNDSIKSEGLVMMKSEKVGDDGREDDLPQSLKRFNAFSIDNLLSSRSCQLQQIVKTD